MQRHQEKATKERKPGLLSMGDKRVYVPFVRTNAAILLMRMDGPANPCIVQSCASPRAGGAL